MNDDTIQDLKQFIEATVSQSEQRLKNELTEELGGRISRVDQGLEKLEHKFDDLELKIDQGFADVAELIDTRVEPVEQEIADHGQRITKLESAKA